MRQEPPRHRPQVPTARAAFEHSITWEDDLWRADPVDVVEVHAARRKFADLLATVTSGQGAVQARILLFLGQSGAGKTHLFRALRTAAHREGKAYFGYAQMTPDVANYADYYLRRLVHSLEKPYDPDCGGESALPARPGPRRRRRRRRDAAISKRCARPSSTTRSSPSSCCARRRHRGEPRFAGHGLDINIVRALLYLQRRDPRIDQRVRQYLYGRPADAARAAGGGGARPQHGRRPRLRDHRVALGQLMWTVEGCGARLLHRPGRGPALLRRLPRAVPESRARSHPDRQSRADRDRPDLRLGDFYGKVREVLAQSYIDRIEKAGPVSLKEAAPPRRRGSSSPSAWPGRRPARRYRSAVVSRPRTSSRSSAGSRRAHPRARAERGASRRARPEADEAKGRRSPALDARLRAGGFRRGRAGGRRGSASLIDFHDLWERFTAHSEAEIPSDDQELLDVLAGALALCARGMGGALDARPEAPGARRGPAHRRPEPAPRDGLRQLESRVFLCNRPTQGGGLKRQLDRVLAAMSGQTCFILRASDFPPNKKNQTAQAFRKFREAGGRSVLVPIPDWERMMMVREFHAQHPQRPRLCRSGSSATSCCRVWCAGAAAAARPVGRNLPQGRGRWASRRLLLKEARRARRGWATSLLPGRRLDRLGPCAAVTAATRAETELPLSVLLDEAGDAAASILAGRALNSSKSITLNTNVLKRHAAVLGGSGSGKTTLALCLIEQLLLRQRRSC